MSTEHTEPDSDEAEEAAKTDEDVPFRSRSQAKREAHAVGALALQLTKLPRAAVLALPLNEEIREAVLECQEMKKNARARQLRRVARLLRESDSTLIAEALASPSGKTQRMEDEEYAHELTRTKLLEGGNAALTELLHQHPHADGQRLRQLIRQAQRVPLDDRASKAKREILRMIRGLVRSTD